MDKRLVLVDTSAWIVALRTKNTKQMSSFVARLLEEDRVATSSLIILELSLGIESVREYRELWEEFGALHQLDFSQKIWQEAYQLGFRLGREGLVIPIVDILLSTLALHYDCELLHMDRHFDLLAKVLPLCIAKIS